MARARKPQPTLESIFFSTPEQKVLRFLISEPTTAFTPRVISSKLKGIRGLGGSEGIARILTELEELGLVQFVDNQRSVRIQNDSPAVQILKTFNAVCQLEGLRSLLEPVSSKGILYGCHADGKAASDSEMDLFVVSASPEEVRKITSRHPLSRQVELETWTPDAFHGIEKQNPHLAQKISRGIVVWGPAW